LKTIWRIIPESSRQQVESKVESNLVIFEAGARDPHEVEVEEEDEEEKEAEAEEAEEAAAAAPKKQQKQHLSSKVEV